MNKSVNEFYARDMIQFLMEEYENSGRDNMGLNDWRFKKIADWIKDHSENYIPKSTSW